MWDKKIKRFVLLSAPTSHLHVQFSFQTCSVRPNQDARIDRWHQCFSTACTFFSLFLSVVLLLFAIRKWGASVSLAQSF